MEYFIVSGISSVLLLRYYLYLTGYPQVGSGGLHISHMLYGGLFMAVAIVMSLSFLGRRIERITAIVGGVGFGVFIDEVGKFITKDNNYFFRPSIGIIYAFFVLLYLLAIYLSRYEKLRSTEYQLNALAGLEEAVLRQMDRREQTMVRNLLLQAEQRSNITKQLLVLLDSIRPQSPVSPNLPQRISRGIGRLYDKAWKLRSSRGIVRAFFIIQILVFVVAVLLALASNVGDVQDFFRGHADYGHSLIVGQAIGTILGGWFALVGVYKLRISRVDALEWFKRATLTNLLLTEFFIFSRIQFGAMPGFIFNLALLVAINFALTHERRGLGVDIVG